MNVAKISQISKIFFFPFRGFLLDREDKKKVHMSNDQNIEYRGNIDGSKIGNFDGNIEEISISVNVREK